MNVRPKKLQFNYVNDKTWASLIEQSVGPVKSYNALSRKQSSKLFSVALVGLFLLFIMAVLVFTPSRFNLV